jgi:hypothetical protein
MTGAADDDPSGIATYSQAGAQFGYGLLWTVFLTTPFIITIQLASAQISLERPAHGAKRPLIQHRVQTNEKLYSYCNDIRVRSFILNGAQQFKYLAKHIGVSQRVNNSRHSQRPPFCHPSHGKLLEVAKGLFRLLG